MNRCLTRALLVVVLLVGRSATARAQESITVVLLPTAVGFSLTSGSATNAGSLPIVVTTSWVLFGSRHQVTLDAYFLSATAALAHTTPANPVDIPSTRIEASVNGGAAAPFNQTVTFGAPLAGRRLFTQSISFLNLVGTHVDTLAFNINLAGFALPADTYSGALRLRAQATP